MGKNTIDIKASTMEEFKYHVKQVRELGYQVQEEPIMDVDKFSTVATAEYPDYPHEDGPEKAAMFISKGDEQTSSYLVKFEMVLLIPANVGIGEGKTVAQVVESIQENNMLLNVGRMARERPDKFKVVTEKQASEDRAKNNIDRPTE